MEWTLENLAVLDQAIIQGIKRVEYEDKTVEYRSLTEMLQIRKLFELYLGLNKSKTRKRLYAAVSKGVTE